MKSTANSNTTDTLRSARVRPDSWLIGALLVLFGVVASVALPQVSGTVRTAVADAAKDGPSERARQSSVRLQLIRVRVAQPKVPGGHDFAAVIVPSVAIVAGNDRLLARPIDLATRARERGFSARAPPFQG